MVRSTLCPAVHILGSQNVYGRAEGIADHYWLCTVDPQMGSAAMKVKKQGCVNRSSLEHSMVITLVGSEFELEAIWLLFYVGTPF